MRCGIRTECFVALWKAPVQSAAVVLLFYWYRRPSLPHWFLDLMIAAFIVVLSVAALIQFAVSQWRAMWITIAEQPLSEFFTATTGIARAEVRAEHFDFLTRTSEQLGTPATQQNLWLKEVGIYYRAVRVVGQFCERQFPTLAAWAEHELIACSRYAAATLDQRLSSHLAFASEADRH